WLEHLNYNAKQGFFSITFVAHPHSRWFIVSHVLRTQLTEVVNEKHHKNHFKRFLWCFSWKLKP
ncbi:hypothetical protein, partial [Staphylococcus felis]|uniref:hypothetical protein n=1 Tax=Staphylococcus felis TaxID=46127 RepID=UPI001EE8FE06